MLVIAAERGTAYHQVRETFLQMLCRDRIKVVELSCRTAPCELVVRVVGREVGLVPYFPVTHAKVSAVSPALVDVRDDMLTDDRPFLEIARRERAVFLRLMLDLAAETVEWLGSGELDRLHILVGQVEVVRRGVVRVGVEVAEDQVNVDRMLAAVARTERRVMRPCKRDIRGGVGVEIARVLTAGAFVDRSVVDCVHGLYLAGCVVVVYVEFHYCFVLSLSLEIII